MISKITINNPEHLPITWWSKAKCLKDIKDISFTPGLNILWGKNGSGKSSVLRLLAKMFHAEAGRYTFITSDSIRELTPFNASKRFSIQDLSKSITVEHDGQGIMYFDPEHRPGLIGGMAGFDYDFIGEGTSALFTKGSSGELGILNMEKLLIGMKDAKSVSIKWKEKYLKEKPTEAAKFTMDFLNGNIPSGPPTFILDEPDRSVDIPNQLKLWTFMRTMAKKSQVIVASHSVFGATIPGANYIEFNPGYLKECRETIGAWIEVSK